MAVCDGVVGASEVLVEDAMLDDAHGAGVAVVLEEDGRASPRLAGSTQLAAPAPPTPAVVSPGGHGRQAPALPSHAAYPSTSAQSAQSVPCSHHAGSSQKPSPAVAHASRGSTKKLVVEQLAGQRGGGER